MIPNVIQRLFRLNIEYENMIEKQRAIRLLQINGIALIVSIIWFIVLGIPSFFNDSGFSKDWAIPLTAVIISSLLYNLIQRGQALWSARIFVGFLFIAIVPIANEYVNSPLIAFSVLPLVLSGALLNRRSLAIVTVLIMAIYGIT